MQCQCYPALYMFELFVSHSFAVTIRRYLDYKFNLEITQNVYILTT